MGASLSRREASPDEPGATAPIRGDDDEALRGDESASAPEAPEAAAPLKRPRSGSKAEVCFATVLEKDLNVSTILAFAGYRTVLRLEELCPRARRIVRGARIELDVSKETNLLVAAKTAARAQLFEARRSGAYANDAVYSFSFNTRRHRATDVVYRDGGALMLSPRPRAPALADGTRGPDCDAARSACAVAATERRRAALLNMGYVEIELGARSVADDAARSSLQSQVMPPLNALNAGGTEAAVSDDSAKLIEAMGGALQVPRRLVLAASCKPPELQKQDHGTRVHLDRALRHAARSSAVLDEGSMQRLAVHVWKAMSQRGFRSLPGEVFLKDVCSAAGIGAEAHALWQEVLNGTLLPFVAAFKPKSGGSSREDADIRIDDVAFVECYHYLTPAFFAFGVTALTRDAATCFSRSPFLSSSTFEEFNIRQCGGVYRNENGVWSAALAVLDDLMTPRNGESSEAGKQRVSDAIQSLLTAERVHALAAGDQIDYAEGDPTPPRDPISWVRGEIVRLLEEKVVIRVNDEEIETFSGHVRLVEEQPPAAAILLAHACADHRNAIVSEILASPNMKNSLSYVVGEPGKSISTRSDARCTALDHAIMARNIVAIGLLWAKYDSVQRGSEDARAWDAVRATCHSLDKAEAAETSPSERADLACALRSSPGAFVRKWNSWRIFEGWTRTWLEYTDGDEVVSAGLVAAVDGDVAGVRKFIASYGTVSLRERLISKPLQLLSSLWSSSSSEVAETADPSELRPFMLQALLRFACKMGREEVVAEVLRCGGPSDPVIDICVPAITAVAEGHLRCLELLVCSRSLDDFLACFATNAPAARKVLGLRLILQAIKLNNGPALNLLQSKGVPMIQSDLSDSHLERACWDGQPDAVRALLRDEEVCKSVLELRSNAITIAILRGHASTLEVLFEKFSVAHVKADADPVLMSAAVSDDFDTFKLVLEQPGVDIDAAPEGQKTPIQIAASHLNFRIVKALLERGAVTMESGDNCDAMRYALNANQNDLSLCVPVVSLLLRERPHEFVSKFWNELKSGAPAMHEETVKAFLDAGADVNEADEYGVTALHVYVYYMTCLTEEFCAERRMPQIIETLIERASVDALTAKTTADVTASSFFLLDNHPLGIGTSPLDIAQNCGYAPSRERVMKTIKAAIRKRNAAGKGPYLRETPAPSPAPG